VSTEHLELLGIFFLVGWHVGADLTRVFYWLRRARRAERDFDEALARLHESEIPF